MTASAMNDDPASTYWNQPPEALFAALPSSPVGLSAAAATRRLAEYGPNLLRAREKVTALRLLLDQFKSPLVFILLVVRTRRPLFKSRPGRYLWVSTLLVGLVTLAIPYLPFAGVLGFVPLPPLTLLLLVAITLLYVVANEIAKRAFYRRAHF